jgi:hypothetical protein
MHAHPVDTRPSLPSPFRRPGDEAKIYTENQIYCEMLMQHVGHLTWDDFM